MNWEENFRKWAKSPSESEQERCENAERVICNALNVDENLAKKDIFVFAQGSYRNNMYVKLDSDVDICVMLRDAFFPQYPEGRDGSSYGHSDSDYRYQDFKTQVEQALVNYFGKAQVTRGSKAFDIHENSYRVDADVVPVFEHRRYTGEKNSDGTEHFHRGIEFHPDKGGKIINWPDQIYSNAVKKNGDTGRRYKAIVRVMKRLRGEMEEKGIRSAEGIPSYLIACLAWNVPNEGFNHAAYEDDVRYTLAHLLNNTRKFEDCKEWGEINELKYLFRDAVQPWTLTQAHSFISSAWDYIGFK